MSMLPWSAVLSLAWATAALATQTPGTVGGQDLVTRVGFTAQEAAAARDGQPVVRVIPVDDPAEVGAAGAIRIRGDIERLAAWLRDIEAFRRALGADVIGTVPRPASPDAFRSIRADDLDLAELKRCGTDRCDILMPPSYASRLKAVDWNAADSSEGTAVVRALLAEHMQAYQQGGDLALGRLYDPQSPTARSEPFRNLLRGATQTWKLAYDLAAYLEEYPQRKPVGIDERFYWTRETAVRSPVVTLHHVVLQRLPDRSLRLADKQFYASRDIESGFLIGQATPTPDGKSFDLVLTLRARVPAAGSMAGRVFRDRVNREIASSFAAYLEWLQRSFAM